MILRKNNCQLNNNRANKKKRKKKLSFTEVLFHREGE